MGVLSVDVVGWRSCVCGGENWLLIVLVLSVKKVAKLSAVIEVVGCGGGDIMDFKFLIKLVATLVNIHITNQFLGEKKKSQ